MDENNKALQALQALLRVPIATPEQAAAAGYVVTIRERMFVGSGRSLDEPNLVRGRCARCETPVVTSSNSPQKPRRICLECAIASGELRGNNMVRTPFGGSEP